MNILEKNISVYRNVFDREGTLMKMCDFLFSDYRRIVEGVRACSDDAEKKRLKAQLPCATISGVFAPTRSAGNLVEHSGAICIDIDKQDNEEQDFTKLKRDLCSLQEAAFVSYSASGQGLFVIIPIAYPERHKEHFYSLQKDFEKMNIIIDAQCKDVSRLRLASYDDEPYVNLNAVPYLYTRKPSQPQEWRHVSHYIGDGDLEKQVEWLVTECERMCLNLTDDYQNWFRIGFALSNLGENGRGFYHRLSRMSGKYNRPDCDKKYNALLGKARISLDFFFDYLAKWGIELPEDFE